MRRLLSVFWPFSMRANSMRANAASYLIRPRDLWLFIRGAQIDAWIARLRAGIGDENPFETIYRQTSDPWLSVSPRYRYQSRKYDTLMSFLPTNRRYGHALDLGCGLGSLACRLSGRAEASLGMDIAQAAVDRARDNNARIPNLHFEQGDILHLPCELNGRFEIVTIVDTIYYISPMSDDLVQSLAHRIADLLVPGGICMLTNHFFFPWDKETRLSRRIHDAFSSSPRFQLVSEHWRPFYLTTLLSLAPSWIGPPTSKVCA
jgi:SAM-dependent methyltransferase